jgi:small-conductance mechanosensitive channel
MMEQLQGDLQVWLWSAGVLIAAALLGFIGHWVIQSAAKRVARRTESPVDDSLVRHSERPLKLILPLLALFLVLPLLPLAEDVTYSIRHLIGLGLIVSLAWLALSLTEVVDDIVSDRYKLDVADNLVARQIHTQIRVLRRIFIVVLSIVTLSIILMTFPSIRQVGTTIFASAGVAGIVIGMAARPTLSSLIAGVQIALTGPIRIDDVVIVENEWGWIEEISTTFVVVRIWDLRRLVLPLSYFIEHPFQNWTRQTADILGTVYIYTDYSVPVEDLRQQLRRILESSELWDTKVCGVQVTNATEHTMEVRALMSASNSGRAWDLRCYVREKMIEFLQQKYPECLPRTRAELQPVPKN